ncbi:hypothetical protein [Nonomuraea sp. NPDC049695]|uniref:hypothetical protein n=1 Tax=Nonomuraea sp. NPDC049695 TaxID=3154734 RepID=UPI0034333CF8
MSGGRSAVHAVRRAMREIIAARRARRRLTQDLAERTHGAGPYGRVPARLLEETRKALEGSGLEPCQIGRCSLRRERG